MEINEKDKVYDGLTVYDKDEYIEKIYPQIKEESRAAIKALQTNAEAAWDVTDTEWVRDIERNLNVMINGEEED